jgi:hypothetical protein
MAPAARLLLARENYDERNKDHRGKEQSVSYHVHFLLNSNLPGLKTPWYDLVTIRGNATHVMIEDLFRGLDVADSFAGLLRFVKGLFKVRSSDPECSQGFFEIQL